MLLLACKFGHINVVNFLLEKGVDYKGVDYKVWSAHSNPIQCAVENGHMEVVKILLTKDASNIDKINSVYGYTLLYIACSKGRRDLVNLLLSFKADVNVPSGYGETPLHHAVRARDLRITKALLSTNKCDLNAKNGIFGKTPLELAEVYGYTDAIFMLKRQKLLDYIKQNQKRPDNDYHGTFFFFSQRINLSYCFGGYSALEKREAAKALLDTLDGKKGVDLQQHKGALTNGVLELVYDSLKEYLPDECRVDTYSFLCF